jgi:hypothetical protein
MRGSSPRSHPFAKMMDCRVKLGNDNRFNTTGTRWSFCKPKVQKWDIIKIEL